VDVRKLIDNSLLRPDATFGELEDFVKRSSEIGFYAVCIPPHFVRRARELVGSGTKVCTVIGFPLGYQGKEIKIYECLKAIGEGAQELDVVVNISALRSGDYKLVEEEVKGVVRHAREAGVVTKFIIETYYLSREQKVIAARIIADSGGDFVKTSTGFAGGATPEDVKLLKESCKGRLKVKASGGIGDYRKFLDMVRAGADRIGTSRGFDIYRESAGG
jgi:deoxyribose-phosphate aldolase